MLLSIWIEHPEPTAQGEQRHPSFQKVQHRPGHSLIFVTPEYNRSIPGALKNALDQAYVEWNRKAFGIVSYGSVGGTRAAEHLRTIGIELQMAATRSAVHIGGSDFFAVHPLGGQEKPLSEIEGSIGPSADAMLDELDWWARATMAARG